MADNTTLESLIGRVRNDPVAAARLASVLHARGETRQGYDLVVHAVASASKDGEIRLRASELLSRGVSYPSFYAEDAARYRRYELAFKRSLRKGQLVLSIGGSNGVLAVLAARCGAKVVACNPDFLLAKTVTDVVARNGMSDHVRVLAKRSQDLAIGVDLDRPVDAIIWGDLADGLIAGEPSIEAVNDAQRRLAVADARVFPPRVRIRVVLAEDGDAFRWQMGMVEGFDLSAFSMLAQARFPVQSGERFTPRSDPVDLIRFDCSAGAPWTGCEQAVLYPRHGRVDGAVSWVVPEFEHDQDGDLASLGPGRAGAMFHRFGLPTNGTRPVMIRSAHEDARFRVWPVASPEEAAPRSVDPDDTVRRAREALKGRDVQHAIDLCRQARAEAPRDGKVALLVAETLSRSVDTWYFNVVIDPVRHALYRDVFQRHIRAGDLVLDIGTGTGLFALMAASLGARVVSCEQNPVVAKVVEGIIAQNGFADRIKVIPKYSSDLEVGVDLERKVDVVVWDNLSNNLIGAGVLPAVEQAVRRLAKPGARVIPRRGHIQVALARRLPPADWLPTVEGFDASALEERFPPRVVLTSRMGRCETHSAPAELFGFDFQGGGPFPGAQTSLTLTADRDGLVDGVVQWVLLDLDETTVDENWPPNPARRGLVSVFHRFANARPMREGEALTIKASHDRDTLRIWTDV